MELQRAIDQISAIHAQVARSELFRGYRAVPVAITSGLAIVTAMAHETLLRPDTLSHALLLWLGYAAACGLICGGDLAVHCWLRGRAFRHQARYVVAQFIPVVITGGVVTGALAMQHEVRALLPGLWTMLFALGIFASLPYLPRAIGWVAAFYLCAGAGLFFAGLQQPSLAPASMGLTFALGQAAIALILHVHLEEGP